MNEGIKIDVVNRRDFVLGASAIAAFTAFASLGGPDAQAQDQAKTWQEAMAKIAGDAKPTDGKVSLELPEIAENGNTVPFTVTIDSPMTDKDYVKSVHLLSTGNPRPNISGFSFSPDSGKAVAASRMRLAKTQDVVAVAQMSDGKWYMGKRTVKVTIGGCGG